MPQREDPRLQYFDMRELAVDFFKLTLVVIAVVGCMLGVWYEVMKKVKEDENFEAPAPNLTSVPVRRKQTDLDPMGVVLVNNTNEVTLKDFGDGTDIPYFKNLELAREDIAEFNVGDKLELKGENFYKCKFEVGNFKYLALLMVDANENVFGFEVGPCIPKEHLENQTPCSDLQGTDYCKKLSLAKASEGVRPDSCKNFDPTRHPAPSFKCFATCETCILDARFGFVDRSLLLNRRNRNITFSGPNGDNLQKDYCHHYFKTEGNTFVQHHPGGDAGWWRIRQYLEWSTKHVTMERVSQKVFKLTVHRKWKRNRNSVGEEKLEFTGRLYSDYVPPIKSFLIGINLWYKDLTDAEKNDPEVDNKYDAKLVYEGPTPCGDGTKQCGPTAKLKLKEPLENFKKVHVSVAEAKRTTEKLNEAKTKTKKK